MRSTHRPLEDEELMAERQVLDGDGRRPEEHGAEERPQTDHVYHGPPGLRHGVWAETLPDQRWQRKFRREKQTEFSTGTAVRRPPRAYRRSGPGTHGRSR